MVLDFRITFLPKSEVQRAISNMPVVLGGRDGDLGANWGYLRTGTPSLGVRRRDGRGRQVRRRGPAGGSLGARFSIFALARVAGGLEAGRLREGARRPSARRGAPLRCAEASRRGARAVWECCGRGETSRIPARSRKTWSSPTWLRSDILSQKCSDPKSVGAAAV